MRPNGRQEAREEERKEVIWSEAQAERRLHEGDDAVRRTWPQVVGNKPIPRTEVVKKLWAYIRKNNLQDAKERRMINADDKLRSVFGGKKQVSMFEMTKLVNKHLS